MIALQLSILTPVQRTNLGLGWEREWDSGIVTKKPGKNMNIWGLIVLTMDTEDMVSNHLQDNLHSYVWLCFLLIPIEWIKKLLYLISDDYQLLLLWWRAAGALWGQRRCLPRLSWRTAPPAHCPTCRLLVATATPQMGWLFAEADMQAMFNND